VAARGSAGAAAGVLAVAEESGLIVPLGEWVLREPARRGSLAAVGADVGICVNLSARQITSPTFAARVAAILADTGLPPRRSRSR